ncbi:MAG: hypothetical protein ACTMHH_03370, partial [Nesterenkonia sp.]
ARYDALSQVCSKSIHSAATAIADVVGDDLAADHIVPSPLDERVAASVVSAVLEAAQRDGAASTE